ncbi:MAG: hypothetical protein PHS33_09355, partial [Candidatus Omnitrophica bacterium]|nr:hypothetical protein [Candidatus Omnitrophota bacterium]
PDLPREVSRTVEVKKLVARAKTIKNPMIENNQIESNRSLSTKLLNLRQLITVFLTIYLYNAN